MTSIPKDKEELRQKIRFEILVPLVMSQVKKHQREAGSLIKASSHGEYGKAVDALMDLNEAHKEQAVLEARLDELTRLKNLSEWPSIEKTAAYLGSPVEAFEHATKSWVKDRIAFLSTRLATLRSKGGE